jgi:exopolyphosphatase/guanosine-5'-triphosphate,3'-diphosphate pyrophosphatase
VIYDGPTRAPSVDFNEKSLCAIGRGMVTTGRLDPDGVDGAMLALARFRLIAEARGVKRVDAVATAAVRDARNGAEFVARARDALGVPVRILTGEEEARTAAEGVLAGIPDADGVVGDLGGGSLELVPVSQGKIAVGHTFPFGPLRLMDASAGRIDKARDIVDAGLNEIKGLDRLKGKALYAVGGVWRSIARIHMRRAKHPVQVLHHYAISREDAIEHTEYLTSRSRKSLEDISEETKKRAEAIPFGAVVMERLFKASKLDRLIVSSYGLREGVLFQRMPDEIRRLDPLLIYARDLAARSVRDPALEEMLVQWSAPLFSGEGTEDARLRRAACIMSDVAWRGHPDHRADDVFKTVLHGSLTAIDHRGRGFLALALFHRYAGQDEFPSGYPGLSQFLGPDACSRAAILGCGLRLAFAISGASSDIIQKTSLRVSSGHVTLTLARDIEPLFGETIDRKLADVAQTLHKNRRHEFK